MKIGKTLRQRKNLKDQGYYDAFQYALFAQREALLRFLTAPQANEWQWQLAYNLARTGDQSAGEVYAILITQELNRDNTTLDELYLWGLKRNPQLLIESFSLESGGEDLNSNLVKVTVGPNGSSYFWLIEGLTGYTSHSLTSDFDFVRPNQIDNFLVQLLGTNSEVVGIFPTKVHESLHYTVPSIFSFLQQQI